MLFCLTFDTVYVSGLSIRLSLCLSIFHSFLISPTVFSNSKLLNPDFETLINNYDILVLVETKTDEYDNIKLPNEYACYAKHRKKFKKKSGGIIIIYKKILSNFLKFIHSDSEFVQWVEILNDISDKSKNVLLGCVYIYLLVQ